MKANRCTRWFGHSLWSVPTGYLAQEINPWLGTLRLYTATSEASLVIIPPTYRYWYIRVHAILSAWNFVDESISKETVCRYTTYIFQRFLTHGKVNQFIAERIATTDPEVYPYVIFHALSFSVNFRPPNANVNNYPMWQYRLPPYVALP